MKLSVNSPRPRRVCGVPPLFRHHLTSALAVLVFAFLAVMSSGAAQISVFAAASLIETLKEIGSVYEHQTTNQVVFNFAGSSTLARQIEEGAPADIFFSADEAQMNRLERKELLAPGTRRDLLSNSLVMVVAADHGAKLQSPQDLLRSDIHRLALGDPVAVPIGVYARQYLEKIGLWDRVKAKVVPVENVRAALAAVAAGNAEASIVYQTDALISTRVTIAYRVPLEQSPSIRYPVALIQGANQNVAAKDFLQFLGNDVARTVFEKRGFMVPGRH